MIRPEVLRNHNFISSKRKEFPKIKDFDPLILSKNFSDSQKKSSLSIFSTE